MHKLNANEWLTNMDAARDTLFCIDRVCKYYTDGRGRLVIRTKKNSRLIYEDSELLTKYSSDEIRRCIAELEDAGMIETLKIGKGIGNTKATTVFVQCLTFDGDNFRCYISNDEIWDRIKSLAYDSGRTSIQDISFIAYHTIQSYIKGEILLNTEV